MPQTAPDPREAELTALLNQVSEHPERAWREERARIAVLQRLLGARHGGRHASSARALTARLHNRRAAVARRPSSGPAR